MAERRENLVRLIDGSNMRAEEVIKPGIGLDSRITLQPREFAVTRLRLAGYNKLQAATILDLSSSTVQALERAVINKTTTPPIELALMATMNLGLLRLDDSLTNQFYIPGSNPLNFTDRQLPIIPFLLRGDPEKVIADATLYNVEEVRHIKEALRAGFGVSTALGVTPIVQAVVYGYVTEDYLKQQAESRKRSGISMLTQREVETFRVLALGLSAEKRNLALNASENIRIRLQNTVHRKLKVSEVHKVVYLLLGSGRLNLEDIAHTASTNALSTPQGIVDKLNPMVRHVLDKIASSKGEIFSNEELLQRVDPDIIASENIIRYQLSRVAEATNINSRLTLALIYDFVKKQEASETAN